VEILTNEFADISVWVKLAVWSDWTEISEFASIIYVYKNLPLGIISRL
jgi:hypothetical protein